MASPFYSQFYPAMLTGKINNQLKSLAQNFELCNCGYSLNLFEIWDQDIMSEIYSNKEYHLFISYLCSSFSHVVTKDYILGDAMKLLA